MTKITANELNVFVDEITNKINKQNQLLVDEVYEKIMNIINKYRQKVVDIIREIDIEELKIKMIESVKNNNGKKFYIHKICNIDSDDDDLCAINRYDLSHIENFLQIFGQHPRKKLYTSEIIRSAVNKILCDTQMTVMVLYWIDDTMYVTVKNNSNGETRLHVLSLSLLLANFITIDNTFKEKFESINVSFNSNFDKCTLYFTWN